MNIPELDREALARQVAAWRAELAVIETAGTAEGLLRRRLDLLRHIDEAEALLAASPDPASQQALAQMLLVVNAKSRVSRDE